jgi:predicted metalloprotease with PDZ domain
MPNDSLLDKFWKDEFWGKLPYQRGFILAMKIDYQLSRKSNYEYTLNSFLKDLLTWSLEHKTQKLTNKIFIQLLNPHLEKPIDDYFNQHIIQGNLMEIEEWKFKDAARIIYQKTKVNDKIIDVPQYKLKADF